MPPTLPRLLEPEQLNAKLGEPLLIIDLCRDDNYDKGHIPGAVHVAPAELMDGGGPAPGKLPDKKRLDALANGFLFIQGRNLNYQFHCKCPSPTFPP
mgnify:CR=1 FL=1